MLAHSLSFDWDGEKTIKLEFENEHQRATFFSGIDEIECSIGRIFKKTFKHWLESLSNCEENVRG